MAEKKPTSSQQGTGDMTPEEFRRAAHDVADRAADYLDNLRNYDVLPKTSPGDTLKKLPLEPPREPETLDAILDDYRSWIEPNITHWQHPGYMAYFPSVASGPGIFGEWLATTLNSNVMFWRNAPSSTELEQRVVDWLRQMLGLPAEFEGMFTDTASMSSLLSLVAARHAIDGLDSRERGLAGRSDIGPLRVYISDQAHMSIDKAAIVIGVGREGIRRVPVDDDYALRADALAQMIEEDRKAGAVPVCVIATLGTTSSNAIDPIGQIAEVCKREKVWLHVDAAYAGAAAVLPDYRHHFDGWQHADSIVFNPHKWFFTPFDASLLLFRERDRFRDAFSLVPEYLQTGIKEEVVNFNEYGIQLGRRFRALKMWMQIRWFGVDGIERRLREHLDWAQQFAQWVDEDPHWERLAPVPFALVCYRYRPPGIDEEGELEAINAKLLDAVNATGRYYLSHSKLGEIYTLRLAVGNPRATIDDVRGCWNCLKQQAALVHPVGR